VRGEADERIDFEDLGAGDVGQRVLLAVDDLLLQGDVEFGEGDLGGGGAEGLEDVDGGRIRRGAELEALEVVRGLDRALAVGDVADAVVPPADRDEADGVELGLEQVADLAVEDLDAVVALGEEERQAEGGESSGTIAEVAPWLFAEMASVPVRRLVSMAASSPSMAAPATVTSSAPPDFNLTSSANLSAAMVRGLPGAAPCPKVIFIGAARRIVGAPISAAAPTAPAPCRNVRRFNLKLSFILPSLVSKYYETQTRLCSRDCRA
jgi:hypothetical protein